MIINFIYWFIYLFNNSQFGEMQLGEMQFGEMPHFFNTPHAFKKNGEMQPGEMPHTLKLLRIHIFSSSNKISIIKD